jgi:tetratricopeptide (TPR) repeat protein
VPTPSPQATLLEEAYAAFQAGKLDEARALYQQRANAGPSADALLGLAAVALAKGQTTEAIRHYQAVLEISPRNPVAQAALIDTLGTTDPVAAESRIKSMIAREPSGFLFYTLGNLYADQGRWSDAEQAYFEARQSEPGNADYAFNLAVSLDHLKQTDAAIRYYETALKLAGPATRFDRAQAESRVSQLKK